MQTVQSSTGYLLRTATLDDLTAGNRSYVGAIRFDADLTVDNGVLFNSKHAGGDDWKLSHRISNQALQWRSNLGATNIDVISGASAYTHWIHFAITRDVSTTAIFAYFLLEGFNPASPSYLITPSRGNQSASGTTLGLWTDVSDLTSLGGNAFGHWIQYAGVLTEAQVLAQFQQRAPTATVAAGTYTYLPCNDATTVHVDAGSTATNFTPTGSFNNFASEPVEWASAPVNSYPFGAGAAIAARNTLLRMSPRSQAWRREANCRVYSLPIAA